MNKKKTTIQLETKTRDELKKLGKKGESYNKIIQRLLNMRKTKND